MDRRAINLILQMPEAALMLGISVRTLYQWRERGYGPKAYKKTGRNGLVHYRANDIKAWLDSKAIKPKTIHDKLPKYKTLKWEGLTASQWARVKQALLSRATGRQSLGRGGELAIRRRIDTGLLAAMQGTWRTLPDGSKRDPEDMNDQLNMARTWAKENIWRLIFNALADDPTFPFTLATATIIVAGALPKSNLRRFLILDVDSTGKHTTKGGIRTSLGNMIEKRNRV